MTKAWSISFAWPLSKRGCSQANRVTLANSCGCNNSPGDDFARHLGLTGLVKLFARRLESFAHRCNHFRFERSGSYEWTNWHGRHPPPQLSTCTELQMEKPDSQAQFRKSRLGAIHYG
jgi:hypothetical protein